VIVLDASAVLAYLRGEPGGTTVQQALSDGACCSAANWSEIMQKSLWEKRDWNAARQLLEGYELVVEPVTRADAEAAARLWDTHRTWSLGDRLCLALAQRLGVRLLTADAAWGTDDPIQQIR